VPFLEDVVPSRFSLYAVLAAAPIVAMWIASKKGRLLARPVVLPLLAMLAVLLPGPRTRRRRFR
jgi:hypothetical protein